MKKKVLAVLLTSAMAATALVGCGGNNAPAEAPAAATEAATEAAAPAAEATTEAAAPAGDYENCTLTMDWWGGDSRHEATQEAVDAFQAKYPGITVEVNFGAWSDWETAKAAEYISGNNPDVQQTNFDWIGKYDADGTTFLDLNTVSDTIDLSQWSDKALGLTVDSKGGLAGLPVSMTGRTFYWNAATFEQAGLEVPATLADLEAAGPVFAEKLGDNYYPLAIGEYDRMILMTYYLQAQYGTPIINEAGNLTFTEDQIKEGLSFIQRLEDEHVIPSEEYLIGEGADSLDKSARFINGEYAGIFEWDTASKKYISALGDAADGFVVGTPFEDMGPNGTGSYQKVSLMFSISGKTEHPHEAAMLLNYLLVDEEGAALMSTERGLPESASALKVLSDAGAIDEFSQKAHDAVANSNPMFWNPKFDDSSLKGDTSAYTDTFDGLSFGDYDLDTATANLYEALTAVAPAAN